MKFSTVNTLPFAAVRTVLFSVIHPGTQYLLLDEENVNSNASVRKSYIVLLCKRPRHAARTNNALKDFASSRILFDNTLVFKLQENLSSSARELMVRDIFFSSFFISAFKYNVVVI